jgi:hypothetical protein
MAQQRGIFGDLCVAGCRLTYLHLVTAVGLAFACSVGYAGTALAASDPCPNAEFRVGPSASLPDCRAYELVTPTDLGRTQDMTFTDFDRAIPSGDGEAIALESIAPIEPNPSTSATVKGTTAVFSRTAADWKMSSALEPGMNAADRLEMSLFSPDLSQVALVWFTSLNDIEYSLETLEVGPVGGPYTPVAENVANNGTSYFLGANAGSAGVPAFSHVLFASTDHALLPSGSERTLAEETVAGKPDLYDWTEGQLRLVNVEGEGEGEELKLVNRCGAELGTGVGDSAGGGATNAISNDGSRVIFRTLHSGPTCAEPSRLYMRVNGRETVEVSAPQGVVVEPSERGDVHYDGATSDGTMIFFSTVTPLTAGESVNEKRETKLFEYDTEEPEGKRLKLIAGLAEEGDDEGPSRELVISEDGSTAYYETGSEINPIYRYDIATGVSTPVATVKGPNDPFEPSYATPNGEFLVFAAWGTSGTLNGDGVANEPRGAFHNELYRYDAADGSVMCVSCGEGPVAPAEGEMSEPKTLTPLEPTDGTPSVIPMSENGQEVFFQTTAQLVAQDTNSSRSGESLKGQLGMDVYEWVADGAEEGPGLFCRGANGCTHLISSGEDVGPAAFLGASRDGSNVFFATAAQLTPQATPEFTNIYDARVDGGFAPPPSPPECVSCQGVGSPPPLFSPGASLTFAGAGNSPAPAVKASPKPTHKKSRLKKKSRKRMRGHVGKSKAAKYHDRRVRASRGRGPS